MRWSALLHRGKRSTQARTRKLPETRDHPPARQLRPPSPPPNLTAQTALNPATAEKTLWTIAWTRPDLRRWLIANPASSPELLEFVAQNPGPGVGVGFEVLFEHTQDDRSQKERGSPNSFATKPSNQLPYRFIPTGLQGAGITDMQWRGT